MVKRKTCVFISGRGSNLKNLIDRSRDYNFPISIKLVVSDKKKALGIYHAKKNSIPMVPIYSKFRIILLAIIIASLAIDKLIFAGTFDSINIPF